MQLFREKGWKSPPFCQYSSLWAILPPLLLVDSRYICGHFPTTFQYPLTLSSTAQKNILKSYSWRSVFSIFFASGLSSYNDAFLTYSAKSTKNPKIQVIWDLGRGNPAILGRENRSCHVAAPPVLTWRMHLFITVSCLRGGGGGGGDGPWHGNQ